MTRPRTREADFTLGPPELPIELVVDTARRRFGVDGEPDRLSGERDLNVVFGRGDDARLCKVSGADEPDVVVDLQIEALLYLEKAAPELSVPQVIRTVDGATSATLVVDGVEHAVRVLTFVSGVPFENETELGVETLVSVGRTVGGLAQALADFDHPGAGHFVLWDISNGVLDEDALWATLGHDAGDLADRHRRRLADGTLPALAGQRRQVIHNDAHAGNVLRAPGTHQVCGVIDFGDMVEAPLVNDLAISASGFLRNDDLSAIDAVAALARGYHDAHPLVPAEIELLYDAVLARLVLTMLLFDYQIHHGTGHADYSRRARAGALDDLALWLGHDRSAATDRFLEEITA